LLSLIARFHRAQMPSDAQGTFDWRSFRGMFYEDALYVPGALTPDAQQEMQQTTQEMLEESRLAYVRASKKAARAAQEARRARVEQRRIAKQARDETAALSANDQGVAT
jgi:hypothetical protein